MYQIAELHFSVGVALTSSNAAMQYVRIRKDHRFSGRLDRSNIRLLASVDYVIKASSIHIQSQQFPAATYTMLKKIMAV